MYRLPLYPFSNQNIHSNHRNANHHLGLSGKSRLVTPGLRTHLTTHRRTVWRSPRARMHRLSLVCSSAWPEPLGLESSARLGLACCPAWPQPLGLESARGLRFAGELLSLPWVLASVWKLVPSWLVGSPDSASVGVGSGGLESPLQPARRHASATANAQ